MDYGLLPADEERRCVESCGGVILFWKGSIKGA